MIQPSRVRSLNDRPLGDRGPVVYWMQQAQRARCNHALEYAIETANELDRPLVVLFALARAYPEATARHYTFLLEGLAETRGQLAGRGVALVVEIGEPPETAVRWARRASAVVCDRGYLRHQRAWRRDLASRAEVRVVQVEADAVVPADLVSNKQEYAARTLRPRHERHGEEYLVALAEQEPRRASSGEVDTGEDLSNVPALIDRLGVPPEPGLASSGEVDTGEVLSNVPALIDRLGVPPEPGPVEAYRGGYGQARRRLEAFLAEKLPRYAALRSDPSVSFESGLSPYLHFGQISPLEVALAAREAGGADDENVVGFLEELLVRRELSINYVLHNDRYDAYAGLPGWARATLEDHADDRRETVYTHEEMESRATHDPYWNAAMREMQVTGKMHNYMRMYWGKKILEWTRSPRTAFRWALEWNNRYFLDGRDPNSFAGVAWCFGLHDRPWSRREVFGTVRYMSAGGLERKFDIEGYVRRVEAM
jgi:deoxyribodipyrimidine photo-lyase